MVVLPLAFIPLATARTAEGVQQLVAHTASSAQQQHTNKQATRRVAPSSIRSIRFETRIALSLSTLID